MSWIDQDPIGPQDQGRQDQDRLRNVAVEANHGGVEAVATKVVEVIEVEVEAAVVVLAIQTMKAVSARQGKKFVTQKKNFEIYKNHHPRDPLIPTIGHRHRGA
jgi:hypothetical protein